MADQTASPGAPEQAAERTIDLPSLLRALADDAESVIAASLLPRLVDLEDRVRELESVVQRRDDLIAELRRQNRSLERQAERGREATATLHRVQTVRCWTNEDGKRFVFADDLADALGKPEWSS